MKLDEENTRSDWIAKWVLILALALMVAFQIIG